MGYASCLEDNQDARDESTRKKRGFIPSNFPRTSQPKTEHSQVQKTQYITSSEIQRRIQREFIRQSNEFIRQSKIK